MGAARPRMRGGDSPLHTKRSGLRGSQPCQHRDLGLPASELGNSEFLCFCRPLCKPVLVITLGRGEY